MPHTAVRPCGRRPMPRVASAPTVGAPASLVVRPAHQRLGSSSAGGAPGVHAGQPVGSARPGWRRVWGITSRCCGPSRVASNSAILLRRLARRVAGHRASSVIRPRHSGPAGSRIRRNGAPTVGATTHLVLASWWAHRVCSPSRRPRGSARLAAGGAYNQPLLWTGPRRVHVGYTPSVRRRVALPATERHPLCALALRPRTPLGNGSRRRVGSGSSRPRPRVSAVLHRRPVASTPSPGGGVAAVGPNQPGT